MKRSLVDLVLRFLDAVFDLIVDYTKRRIKRRAGRRALPRSTGCMS